MPQRHTVEPPATGQTAGDDVVDVIVPVHDNKADANRLMASLASAKTRRRFTLTVVDDASTEALPLALPPCAGSLVDVTLLRNATNLGFAASVNRGIERTRRDVVLLNSDTIVFEGWLDRLCDAARDPRVATVTPLSNAATILSYPTFLHDTAGRLETAWSDIDRFCAALASPPVEIPTGVGFCLFVRRACLDGVGGFDAAVFGAGYGEETDFCRRAAAAGWIHRAATNIFVWHRGSGSFGARRAALVARAEMSMRARHPGYDALVAAFIKRDPLRTLRCRLDVARVAADPRPTRLDLGPPVSGAGAAGVKIMRLAARPSRWRSRWAPEVDGYGPLPNLPALDRFSSPATIIDLLRGTGVCELIVPARPAQPRALVARLRAAVGVLGLHCRLAGRADTGDDRHPRRFGGPAVVDDPTPAINDFAQH